MDNWAIIGTWPFALQGVEALSGRLATGVNAVDAAVEACLMVEDDPEVDTVGLGGIPNAQGEVELDAAVMDGTSLEIGAVGGVRHHKNPILIARELLYHPSHNMLVAQGAEAFAQGRGIPQASALTEKAKARWQQLKDKAEHTGHDTVCFLTLSQGRLAAAVSTSGLGLKMPGRIGDSPLPGSGFYADDEAGAAAATGMGEEIMKGLLSFRAVEHMRLGLSPQAAAEKSLLDAHMRLLRAGKKPGNMALICLDKLGRLGAACNHQHFAFAAASAGQPPKLHEVMPLIDNAVDTLPPELAGRGV
jgi:isoaspartyl peptidase/L-asparaginase-like protein (Ntn-hydrolase superfamily)